MERGFAGLLGGWAHEALPQLRPRSDILLPLSNPVSQIGLVGILHQIKEGDYEEATQQTQLSKFSPEGIACPSPKHSSAVLHGADAELDGIFLP